MKPRIALWRKSMAADSGLRWTKVASKGGALEFSLAHNVGSRREVDAAMLRAKRAGAKIVKQARPTFYGGYAGYFQDPDGHLWEVAFNPGLGSL